MPDTRALRDHDRFELASTPRAALDGGAWNLLAVAIVLAMIFAAVTAPTTAAGLVAGAERPTPTPPPSDGPLGTPAPAPNSDAFEFAATQRDGTTPVTFDPCRPIHVVVNDAKMPAAANGILEEALEEVSRATGLRFVVEGRTDEPPTSKRPAFQPDRYGDRWAPVLVAWSDPDEVPRLDGAVGLGGSTRVHVRGDRWVYVTGAVTLDGPDFAQMADDGVERGVLRAVIMHELGHVVGLAHVDDPAQLMHGQAHPTDGELSDGDLAGLAQLGAGECVPAL